MKRIYDLYDYKLAKASEELKTQPKIELNSKRIPRCLRQGASMHSSTIQKHEGQISNFNVP
jgi:hypothetical protein